MGASHTRKTKMNSPNSKEEKKEQHASSSARPLAIEGTHNIRNSSEANIQVMENQPRQPNTLQGLLKFAMEANQSEDVSHQAQVQTLDEERKAFLNAALSSLTVNVVDELQNAVKTLSKVVDLRDNDDPSEYEGALERIADFVDSMDIANDFYKIGGFSIFGPCLNSPHSSIRWRTAEVIAELAQNNPYCQERILETGLFPILLSMVDTDPSNAARIKALYAISCIVRGHSMSMKYMDINDGYSVLLRAMQSPVEKLQIKSAFLLSSLCSRDKADVLKTTLVNMGLVEQVIGLLKLSNLLRETREQLLCILDGMTSNNFLPALRECRRTDLCLKLVLEQHLKDLHPEENREELDICQRLLDTLFAEPEMQQER